MSSSIDFPAKKDTVFLSGSFYDEKDRGDNPALRLFSREFKSFRLPSEYGGDMSKTRVIIADDHQMLNDAIKNLLEPEYEVVGTFTDGESLVHDAAALSPDVALIDVSMPKMNGLIACGHLKKMLPRLKVIFLTMNQDLDTVGEAFRSGASGYVLKTSAVPELKTAIREVLRGGYFATPRLTEGVIGSFVQSFKKMKPQHFLTLRQKEVLQLLAEGYSMKQVANALDITPRTVAFHKYAIMEELGINSSAELISYFMRSGIGTSQA
jgi:DNA-binding NarL/FixJ family response regulator